MIQNTLTFFVALFTLMVTVEYIFTKKLKWFDVLVIVVDCALLLMW